MAENLGKPELLELRSNETQMILRELRETATQAEPKDVKSLKYRIRIYSPWKIEYAEDGIISNVHYTVEDQEHTSDLSHRDWISRFVDESEAGQIAMKRLSDIFGRSRELIGPPVKGFLAKTSEATFENDIKVLLNDLEGGRPIWQVSAKLYGVIPSTESLSISEGVELRGVLKDDLVSSENALHRLDPPPHAILVFSRTGFLAEIIEHLQAISIAIALFKETPAVIRSYRLRTESYTQNLDGEHFAGRNFSTKPLVVLDKAETKNVNDFYELILPRIPSAVIRQMPVDPIEIGLKRYLDSLRNNVVAEERLTFAVMAFEALLSENETELKFRLSSRSARLLGYLGENAHTVFSDLSKAYGFRSLHVHGSSLTPADRIRCEELMDRVWRYLRKTLVFMLVRDIISEAKKKLFLKDLDKAMIDEESSGSLRANCSLTLALAKGAIGRDSV